MIDKKNFLYPQVTDEQTWFLDNDIKNIDMFICDKHNNIYYGNIRHIVNFGNTVVIGIYIKKKIYSEDDYEDIEGFVYEKLSDISRFGFTFDDLDK